MESNIAGRPNVFKERVWYSVLSTCVLQTVILFAISCFAHFDPWGPLEWVCISFERIMSLRIWCSVITLCTLIAVQCFVYSQIFVDEYKIAGSRFSQLRIFFSFNYMLLLILHMIVWGTISWTIMELFEIYFEDPENRCVSEKRIILLTSGVFFGTYFLVFDCRSVQKPSPRYLHFPTIHQLKFLQVKMCLFPIVKQSVVDALSPTLVFFVFYLWKGNNLREIVYEFHDLVSNKLCKDENGIWSVGTIFHVWFFMAVAFNIVYSMKLLFRVHLTEYRSFPVTAPFGSHLFLTLHEALLSSNPVIMQLGYLDLRVLSEKDSSRRNELFTLSHLGGHPHNWNAVVDTTLKMIKDFSDKLKVAISDEPNVVSACKTKSEENYSKFEVSSPYKSALRNLSPGRYEPITPNVLNTTVLAPAAEDTVFDVVTRQAKGSIVHLLDKPGIRYFFSDRVELNVHYVMSRAQPVIWAIDGLSLLAATSIVLDKYGVALKDLPVLLTTLLDLKQVLDRLHKMSTFKKELRSYETDVKMRKSLQAAVKRSVYKITIAFRNHFNELPVTSNVRSQLKPFVFFKEG